MDPFSALIGLGGLLSQSSAQGTSTALALRNLEYQEQRDREQQRFAQASRTDAYGNVQRYNAATNTWEEDLTPTQNQLLKAGEHEQLLSVTEDAQRNRRIKENAEKRGHEAANEYNTALAGYKYDQPKSEGAIRDELATLMGPQTEAGIKSGQAASIRQALRTGAGALIPTIVKSADDAIGAQNADNNLKIRNQAVQEAAAKATQHDQRYLPELDKFSALMDAGGGAPQKFSGLPESMASQQASMAQAIQAAMSSGSSAIGSAGASLATAAGKSPDFGKLASYFTDSTKTGRARAAAAKATPYSLTTPNAVDDDSYGAIYTDPNYDPSDRLDFTTTGQF